MVTLIYSFIDFSIAGVTTMEIVEAGLQVLENEVIAPVTLESIRLMRNRISSIEEDAFRYSYHVKKSHGKHVCLVLLVVVCCS